MNALRMILLAVISLVVCHSSALAKESKISFNEKMWPILNRSCGGFVNKCRDVDKAVYALITDLKQRGMPDDTLIVWGEEFGRTPMRENSGGKTMSLLGRDHNPGAFSMWVAGAGVKTGSYGETDAIGYRAIKDKVSVQDLQVTILNRLGLNHKKLTYPFYGLDQTLSGATKPATVRYELFT